jgi:isoleucyl-tRNA synthetase
MSFLISLGKIFSPVATVATAAAAVVGVISYKNNRKKEVCEQKKKLANEVRNALKTLRNESQFLASYLGKDDLNSPLFLATSEIRAEMARRLAETNMTVTEFSEHLEKSNVMYFCILTGWQNSRFTQEINNAIEKIKTVEFSLTGKFAVIGALGFFMVIFIQKKFSPAMYFPFWKEALEKTRCHNAFKEQVSEKRTVQEILNVFEDELLKATFQHFRQNNYHQMVDSFNSFINFLTLPSLKTTDNDIIYQLATAEMPYHSMNLNKLKNLSSSLNSTVCFDEELKKIWIEIEVALGKLEPDLKKHLPELFGKYKFLRKQITKDIESYIDIIEDNKTEEKKANTEFSEQF